MRFNQDLKKMRGRIRLFQILLFFCFLVVILGFFKVQIIHGKHYESLGQKYRLKNLPVKPQRGLFYSRDGSLLVENQPTYTLVLHRDSLHLPWNQALQKIVSFFDCDPESIDSKYQLHRGRYLGLPIPLITQMKFRDVLRLKRQQKEFPYLKVQIDSERYHRLPYTYSHILGYVGAVTPRQLLQNPALKPGDVVGRTGLEQKFNDLLSGSEGMRTVQIDSRGVFQETELTRAPVPGADMTLTLSEPLQQKAVSILGDQIGIILLMDVNSGDILVYYSSPTYDLNLFTGGISQKAWKNLNESPLKPLFNRPIQGTYAPGSTFKIVTAIAGLKTGVITPGTRFMCSGTMNYLGRDFQCHKRSGHGWVDLSEAIMESCNIYMYHVAREIDAKSLSDTAIALGLGVRTGVDLPGETAGVMPSPQWKKERYHKIWYPGETLSMSIGQGDIQITPLQMLRLMSLVANNGLARNPHFLKSYKQQGKEYQPELEIFQAEGISPDFFKIVRHAMWRTINDDGGTGHHARIPGFGVCGKTGTAQRITFKTDDERKEKKYQNAWFAGFAPYRKPEVAVVVLVEHGGHGGSAAAPLARILLESYLKSPIRKQILDAF